MSKKRRDYKTSQEWHRAVIGGENVILRTTSALEEMNLLLDYDNDDIVEVYALQNKQKDNIEYCIVETFDGIETMNVGDVVCTTPSQTFDDIMDEYDSCDENALLVGLTNYYLKNGESYDGLSISERNLGLFDYLKEWAMEYYYS